METRKTIGHWEGDLINGANGTGNLATDVFFAHPCHSWERGTNENTNGLIRRLYPKKSSFAGIGRTELARIEAFVNDRPRKCLGWSTPREVLTAFLGRAP